MSDPIRVERRDLAGSRFTGVNLSGARFDDVDLSGAVFSNVNLRGARFGAIDFGGAEFSCMNTGENRRRRPAAFNDVELDGCTFAGGSFARVRIDGARLDGMTIAGHPVEEMIELYRKARRVRSRRGAFRRLARWLRRARSRGR